MIVNHKGFNHKSLSQKGLRQKGFNRKESEANRVPIYMEHSEQD